MVMMITSEEIGRKIIKDPEKTKRIDVLSKEYWILSSTMLCSHQSIDLCLPTRISYPAIKKKVAS